MLNKDIADRNSLVMISADPFYYENAEVGVIERSWLDNAGIMFDAYYLIDYKIQKEDAGQLVQNASVIFLLGGYTVEQHDLLIKYQLSGFIKKSSAVVIGTSAGAKNMSFKWVCSKYKEHNKVSFVYDSTGMGLGLNHFSFEPHADFDNTEFIQGPLFHLSEETDIYLAGKNGAVRVKDGKIDIIGSVYLISKSRIQKLDETL